MSLYRKHRPQKFMDLVGQDHIRQTVTNALGSGKISHAYLFAGPKGSGKTTTARLLAKALNCSGRNLEKESFEPCNKCQSCLEVTSGNSMDVIEIDAASNRGIDEIRELRDKVRFAPSGGKYKVYIIDECHMLTKEAFNALLKTLEEPPAHAVFILATTELHKVPATILSRTQYFDFKKGKPEEILTLLKKLAKSEKLKIEEDALKLLSRLSFGAYRDAVSMLDQISSLKTDEEMEIKLSDVQLILGQTTEGVVLDFVAALADRDRQKALEIAGKIYFEGKDLENFIAEVVGVLRKILLLKAGLSLSFEAGDEEIKILENIAEKFSISELTLAIEKMVEAASQVKTSVMGQLPLEMVVFELTEGQQVNQENQVNLDKQEKKPEKIFLKSEPVIQDIKKEKPVVQDIATEKNTTFRHTNLPSDMLTNNSITSFWPDVIKAVKVHNNAIAAMLAGAVIESATDDQINLKVKFKFHAEQICNKKNLTVIEAEIAKVAGKNYKIECAADKDLDIEKPLDDEEKVLTTAQEVFEVEE